MRVLVHTIAICEAVFVELEALIPDPVRVPQGDDFVFRYEDGSPHIVVVQKLGRIATRSPGLSSIVGARPVPGGRRNLPHA